MDVLIRRFKGTIYLTSQVNRRFLFDACVSPSTATSSLAGLA